MQYISGLARHIARSAKLAEQLKGVVELFVRLISYSVQVVFCCCDFACLNICHFVNSSPSDRHYAIASKISLLLSI